MNIKEAPFAYVLIVERDRAETLVSVYESLDEVEDALRDYVKRLVVGHFRDDEIVETLIEEGCHAVHIYECAHDKRRKTQTCAEVTPFEHSMVA